MSHSPQVRRRDALRLGIAGWLGATLTDGLSATAWGGDGATGAANMILVWLGGGPATIDMWDPKPDAPDRIRGEFSTIDTSVPGARFCEHLPRLAELLDRCTLIRSLRHSIPAHGPGAQYLLTGHLPSSALTYPSLGAIAASRLPARKAIPPYVAFAGPSAGNAGYLGSAWNPFALDDETRELPKGVSLGDGVDRAAFAARLKLRNEFDREFDALNRDPVAGGLKSFQQQAVGVLQEDSIRQALDLSQEAPEAVESFGQRSAVGRNALRAVRLIEAGARFVTVGMSGWDTHLNNFPRLRNGLLPQLDLALSGLIRQLEARDLLSSTMVCCCGEFGRTPAVNGGGGRDHWSRAMSVLLAGGGLQRGRIYGATDKHGGEPTEDECSPADLAVTLLRQLGIDPATTLTTPAGREVPLTRSGQLLPIATRPYAQ